jgi:hypothetical protein
MMYENNKSNFHVFVPKERFDKSVKVILMD